MEAKLIGVTGRKCPQTSDDLIYASRTGGRYFIGTRGKMGFISQAKSENIYDSFLLLPPRQIAMRSLACVNHHTDGNLYFTEP